ncbi:hypothetical protein Rhopal_006839-T1 [Rhodotorula paludigena]|uniref:Proteophosphoglycan ppg4 n=1 Tax=Rhodotorula paludigena TaxID=86838 RepID=A0AAV5GMH1_9BASI|nr:hypothetical protein Rhopal_006839-T1 [Rhodotorula paludigena]
MGVLRLPEIPAGANPYEVIYERFHNALNPLPSPGFAARLYVLWGLMGYGIIISFVYLCTMAVEYRRREKRFWLWKLVTRPNGRYIVGNQHALFAVFSFIGCAVFLGYVINFRRVAILQRYQQRAYFWRCLIWSVRDQVWDFVSECSNPLDLYRVPLIIHAWISSWSNLQAAVLSSQKATKRHLLSPRFANSFYIVGLVIILVPVIVLNVYTSFAWRHAWEYGLGLRTVLLARSITSGGDTPDQASAVVQPMLDELNDKLDFFLDMIRSGFGVYVLAMLVIIAVNLGGLGLLFTLRRQIKFNTRRLSTQIRTTTLGTRSSVHGLPVAGPVGESTVSSTPPDSPDPPHPLSPDPNHLNSPPPQKTLLKHVFFAKQGNEDDENKGMSMSALKHAAEDTAPASASQRQQAKQLLALKKVEWDLFVFLGAIVLMATLFLALSLWLTISPLSVFRSWMTMEVSFFLVPWMYLVGVDVSLTFLLINSLRHLLSSDSRFANAVGIRSRPLNRRASVTGLTTSDELESMSYSRPARIGAEDALEPLSEEEEDAHNRQGVRIHVAVETQVVEEESGPDDVDLHAYRRV